MAVAIKGYNPDILSCLANLSNDEIFTPPEIANDLLDLLPQEIFSSRTTTFLDPGCKSGVFLREIAKRLINAQLPDYEKIISCIDEKRSISAPLSEEEEIFLEKLQPVVDHIFHHQIYGIAITELTSLLSRRSVYCTKNANSEFSVSHFDTPQGNIRFSSIKHTWKNGKCIYCGAPQAQYDRSDELESHAYEWIHTDNPGSIFNIDFDVIITNPPYDLSDGGAKASSKPIYQYFIDQSRALKPRYFLAVTPARWFSGGKGLDNFRASMLNDPHIRSIVDYTDSSECFPGIDISGGACYFLWDREYSGDCSITNIIKGKKSFSRRPLNEFPTFVRYSTAADIIKKVAAYGELTMDTQVSSRKPFGLDTAVSSMSDGDLTLRYSKGLGKYKSSLITSGRDIIDKWKTIISYASYDHAGQPDKEGMRKVMSVIEVLPPRAVCSEVYLVAGSFDTEAEANNLRIYLRTRFVRFLVAQIAVTQHITKGCFAFVPVQDFKDTWSDAKLYKKYKLTDEEIGFIESLIRPIDKETNPDE